jgi:hypothetical protein
MVKGMLSPSRHKKILVITLTISLLLLLSNSCYAETYSHSYRLRDSPDGSTDYRLTISVTETLYDYYVTQDHNLYSYNFSKFVTPHAVQPIADDLWSIYSNKEDFANGVLVIMHQIPYVESSPQKFPVEILAENEGDCDLFCFTAASIMTAGGLDVVLLLMENYDHMMLGVHLPDTPEDARTQTFYYEHEGKKYYVAETTGDKWETGWRVGECHESLQSAAAKIYTVTGYETASPGQVSSSYTMPGSAEINMILSTNFALSQNEVKITGTLSPSLVGETVTLYVSSFGSSLNMLAKVETDSNGHYSYTWNSPPTGVHTLRANWSGDDDYRGADSSTSRLVVIASEYLIMGGLLIFFLVILLVVTLVTRSGKSDTPEAFQEWEFTDYGQEV